MDPECLVPGKEGEVTSRIGSVVDRQDFEQMKDEYYQIRNWNVETGYPTKESLITLDLKDVADDLERRNLLGKSRL